MIEYLEQVAERHWKTNGVTEYYIAVYSLIILHILCIYLFVIYFLRIFGDWYPEQDDEWSDVVLRNFMKDYR